MLRNEIEWYAHKYKYYLQTKGFNLVGYTYFLEDVFIFETEQECESAKYLESNHQFVYAWWYSLDKMEEINELILEIDKSPKECEYTPYIYWFK